MRKFVNHKICVDFDWSHNHTNESNGRSFKIGTVHVQEWNMGKDGEFHRISEKARFMSNKEMKSMVRLSKLFPDFVTFLEQAYKCLIINTLIYTLGDAEK